MYENLKTGWRLEVVMPLMIGPVFYIKVGDTGCLMGWLFDLQNLLRMVVESVGTLKWKWQKWNWKISLNFWKSMKLLKGESWIDAVWQNGLIGFGV